MSLLNMEARFGVPVLETEDDMEIFLTEIFLYETKERPPQPPFSPPGFKSLHGRFAAADSMLCCLRRAPPIPCCSSLPLLHKHTDTHTYAALHSISLCAPRVGSTLETSPPSLPPVLSLSLTASFPPFMPLRGTTDWAAPAEEESAKRQSDGGISSMQATADMTKKECLWSSWKGQGTDAFLWFYSRFACRLQADGLCFMHAHVRLLIVTFCSFIFAWDTPLVCICTQRKQRRRWKIAPSGLGACWYRLLTPSPLRWAAVFICSHFFLFALGGRNECQTVGWCW